MKTYIVSSGHTIASIVALLVNRTVAAAFIGVEFFSVEEIPLPVFFGAIISTFFILVKTTQISVMIYLRPFALTA